MTKEWVDQKNKEYQEEMQNKIKFVQEEIRKTKYIPDNKKDELIEALAHKFDYEIVCYFDVHVPFDNIKLPEDEFEKCRVWAQSLDIKKLYDYYQYEDDSFPYNEYEDSKEIDFDGDIIITDPCYIMKDLEDHGKHYNEWWDGLYSEDLSEFGIHTFMARNTIYGDWSCTTFNSDTQEVLGQFCADGGEVGVFLLDEVKQYNPGFDWYKTKPWTTTLIKDFKGTVQFVVIRTEGEHEDTTEFHKKGDRWEYYSVEVVGKGINKITGEALNFVGRQTGF